REQSETCRECGHSARKREHVGADTRGERPGARADEGSHEARRHEDEPGGQRTPAEQVLEVERVDDVECGRGTEKQCRTEVGAYQPGRTENRKAHEWSFY